MPKGTSKTCMYTSLRFALFLYLRGWIRDFEKKRKRRRLFRHWSREITRTRTHGCTKISLSTLVGSKWRRARKCGTRLNSWLQESCRRYIRHQNWFDSRSYKMSLALSDDHKLEPEKTFNLTFVRIVTIKLATFSLWDFSLRNSSFVLLYMTYLILPQFDGGSLPTSITPNG